MNLPYIITRQAVPARQNPPERMDKDFLCNVHTRNRGEIKPVMRRDAASRR